MIDAPPVLSWVARDRQAGRNRARQPQGAGSMIRRYIFWRNKHAADERLREIVDTANVA